MHRRQVETEFDMRTGGEVPFGSWLVRQSQSGVSLRRLADMDDERTGCRVSHEAIRLWLREG